MIPCEQAQIRFSCQGTTEAGSTQPNWSESTSLVVSMPSRWVSTPSGGIVPPLIREVIPSWNTTQTFAIGPSAVTARSIPSEAPVAQSDSGPFGVAEPKGGAQRTYSGLAGSPAASSLPFQVQSRRAFGVFAPASEAMATVLPS